MNSGAFESRNPVLRRLGALKRWVKTNVLRRTEERTAHSVVPQGYVVLTNMESHTLAECQRADEHNRELYAYRLDAVQSATPGISCDPVEEPPSPDNASRYETFCLHNTPVAADLQARAVEALAAAGFISVRDYPPHQAVEFQKARNVPCVSCDAPSQAMEASSGPNYTLFSDDELRTKSKRECLRTDRENNNLYRKASKRCRKARERLGSVTRVHMEDLSQSKQSNYQRKIRLKSRDTLVSAKEQSAAVEMLYHQGYRLYVDYEPENSIALSAQLSSQLGAEPSECEGMPPQEPLPPVVEAYPWQELTEMSIVDSPRPLSVHSVANEMPTVIQGRRLTPPPIPAWPPASHFRK